MPPKKVRNKLLFRAQNDLPLSVWQRSHQLTSLAVHIGAARPAKNVGRWERSALYHVLISLGGVVFDFDL